MKWKLVYGTPIKLLVPNTSLITKDAYKHLPSQPVFLIELCEMADRTEYLHKIQSYHPLDHPAPPVLVAQLTEVLLSH